MKYNVHILISTKDQLIKLLNNDISLDRIYIESSLAIKNSELVFKLKDNICKNIYLVSPRILRSKDYDIFLDLINKNEYSGILVRNNETLSLLKNYKIYLDSIVLDYGMYILNDKSLEFYIDVFDVDIKEFYNSIELSKYEIDELVDNINLDSIINSQIVYGHSALMISANCIKKTLLKCNHNNEFIKFNDRLNKDLYADTNCDFCYNTIFNAIPLSLHKYYNELINRGNVRLDFTYEDPDLMMNIINYFINYNKDNTLPYKEFTNGLYRRGVE